MARVHAPLYSFAASGRIGNALIYSKWKKQKYVKKYAAPGGKATPPQLAQRALMQAILQYAQEQFNDETSRDAWRASQAHHAPMLTPWAHCISTGLKAGKPES